MELLPRSFRPGHKLTMLTVPLCLAFRTGPPRLPEHLDVFVVQSPFQLSPALNSSSQLSALPGQKHRLVEKLSLFVSGGPLSHQGHVFGRHPLWTGQLCRHQKCSLFLALVLRLPCPVAPFRSSTLWLLSTDLENLKEVFPETRHLGRL